MENTPSSTTPENPAPSTSISAAPVERSIWNEAQLADLTRTEEICRISLLPEYLPSLIADEEDDLDDPAVITAEKIIQLQTDCKSARSLSSDAVEGTVEKTEASQEEDTLEQRLVAALQTIQARARQKHGRSATTLSEYGIGERIDSSRAVLEQFAAAIHKKASGEKLPGVKASQLEALQQLIADYQQVQTKQGTSQGGASGSRQQRNKILTAILERRMAIQFAADALWHYSQPENAPTRRLFQLPANRPFTA